MDNIPLPTPTRLIVSKGKDQHVIALVRIVSWTYDDDAVFLCKADTDIKCDEGDIYRDYESGKLVGGIFRTECECCCESFLLFINRGLLKMRYPADLNFAFFHWPMVHPRNLFFQLDFHMQGPNGACLSNAKAQIKAVLAGQVPMVRMLLEDVPKKALKRVKASGLPFQKKGKYLSIAQDMTLGEVCDVKLWLACYWSKSLLSEEDLAYLYSLRNFPLAHWLSVDAWDLHEAQGKRELALRGLLLGLPLDSPMLFMAQ